MGKFGDTFRDKRGLWYKLVRDHYGRLRPTRTPSPKHPLELVLIAVVVVSAIVVATATVLSGNDKKA
jgi:hypothetical protein